MEETVAIVPVKKTVTVIQVMAKNFEGSVVQRISVMVKLAGPMPVYTVDTVILSRSVQHLH